MNYRCIMATMYCPFCEHHLTKVTDSRLSSHGQVTRRRRQCLKCDTRFTTFERAFLDLPLIIKRDGRREAFDRNKIIQGLEKSCEKRPISTENISHIVDSLERSLAQGATREIHSRHLGDMIMDKLKSLDQVAYIRFASVYKEFKNLDDFLKDIGDNHDLRQQNQDKYESQH